MKTFLITDNDAGQRLDKFIFKVTDGLPASLLYKGMRKNAVKLNSKRPKPQALLQSGDVVELWFKDEFFGEAKPDLSAVREKPEIVYEDENVLIADKRAGLSCHPDKKQKSGTLIDIIKAYLICRGEYDPEKENSFAPALCNRIDRNTKGLVICAKTAVALREINGAIKNRLFEKEYLALVNSKPKADSGTLKNYLLKDSDTNTVKVFDTPVKGALTAISTYKLIKYDSQKNVSVLRIRILTGRTHQIRAQFAHAGTPLVGDGKYGVTGNKKQLGFSHQALLSKRLTLRFSPDSPLYYLNGKSFEAQTPGEFEL